MKKFISVIIFCLFATIVHSQDDGWISLFNGKNFDGWIFGYDAERLSRIEDGVIVTNSVKGGPPATYIVTRESYENFILTYEFKCDPHLNSGVQVRSIHAKDGDLKVKFGDKEFPIKKGQVGGFQMDIDIDPKRNRWFTSGIYEERGRGWLFPGPLGGDKQAFGEQGKRISKVGDWNEGRIECVNNHIKTWLNGELRVDLEIPDMFKSGVIALQIHEPYYGMTNVENRWRNIKIKKLP